ncbi:Ung Uracil DNA glycosylase [Candidatus Planktophila vernalis]|uniref:uracil-DNA glycosylase n=1 Tax=Candidatus Planktophila vernalis TaxID=1884907 RepID=UPI003CEBA2BD
MGIFDQLHPEWQKQLADYKPLVTRIDSLIDKNDVTPAYENIFAAYQLPPEDIKIAIFGQDPYPTPGYAHGLAFSVSAHIQPLPASLRNIFKELENDCGVKPVASGDLHRWANQGVLLLNQILTTRPTQSLAHENFGWQEFTEATAKIVGESGAIGIFWGAKAQQFAKYFDPKLSISSAHPSPLSAYRGFFGSAPFSKTNALLRQSGKKEINW